MMKVLSAVKNYTIQWKYITRKIIEIKIGIIEKKQHIVRKIIELHNNSKKNNRIT